MYAFLEGIDYGGENFELSKENVGTIFVGSTSLPYNDNDEWLDSPPVCSNDSHEGGVYLSCLCQMALSGNL